MTCARVAARPTRRGDAPRPKLAGRAWQGAAERVVVHKLDVYRVYVEMSAQTHGGCARRGHHRCDSAVVGGGSQEGWSKRAARRVPAKGWLARRATN